MSLLDDENILMGDIKTSSQPMECLVSLFNDKINWNKQIVQEIIDNILPKLPPEFKWEIEDNSLYCIWRHDIHPRACPLYIRFLTNFDKKYTDSPVDYDAHVYWEEVNGEATLSTKKWLSIQDRVLKHLKIKNKVTYHALKRNGIYTI